MATVATWAIQGVCLVHSHGKLGLKTHTSTSAAVLGEQVLQGWILTLKN